MITFIILTIILFLFFYKTSGSPVASCLLSIGYAGLGILIVTFVIIAISESDNLRWNFLTEHTSKLEYIDGKVVVMDDYIILKNDGEIEKFQTWEFGGSEPLFLTIKPNNKMSLWCFPLSRSFVRVPIDSEFKQVFE